MKLMLAISACLTLAVQAQERHFEFDVNLSDDLEIALPQCARFINDHTIAWSGSNAAVHLINLQNLAEERTLTGLIQDEIDKFIVSADGRYLVGTSSPGELLCWDLSNGEKLYSTGYFQEGYSMSHHLTFFKEDSQLMVNETSLSSGCVIYNYEMEKGVRIDSILAPKEDCVYMIARTKQKNQMLISTNEGLCFYNLKTKVYSDPISVEDLSVITDLKVSPDGKLVAAAGRSGILIFSADLQTKKCLISSGEWINEVQFSTDGNFFFSCSGSYDTKDPSVKVWSTKSWELITSFRSFSEKVSTIDISPNQNYLAATSWDGSIQIYNLRTDSLILRIVPVISGNQTHYIFHNQEETIFVSSELLPHISIVKDGVAIEPSAMNLANNKLVLTSSFQNTPTKK